MALPGGGGGAVRDRDCNNSIQDTLAPVTSFNYLWIILLASYNNWPIGVNNIQKARKKWAQMSIVLRRHCHVQDTIMILEEGNQPYLLCFKCNMFVSHMALNGRHLVMSFCSRGEEIKWHCLV